MTEIPEHLRKAAARAIAKVEEDNKPDQALKTGPDFVVALTAYTSAGSVIVHKKWEGLDLSDFDNRDRFEEQVMKATTMAISEYNRNKVIATEVDVEGIAEALGADSESVTDALAKLMKGKP